MELFPEGNFECLPPEDNVFIEILKRSYCLLYGIPSLFLYILVLCTLRRKKTKTTYSPTFVHLFSLSCIFNMGCWIMEYIFSRIFCVLHFCDFLVSLTSTYYLVLPFFVYQFFPVASFVCCVLIATYQTAVLYFPLDIETSFARRRRLLSVLSLGIPAIFCIHILFGYTTVMPLPSGKIYVKAQHWWGWMYQLTTPAVNSAVGIIVFIWITTCSILSIARIPYLRFKNDHRLQLRVFFVIFFMCATSLIFAVYQVWLFYTRTILEDGYMIATVIQFREFVVDVCYLPLPWIVIIVNKRVRRSLPIFNKMKKHKITITFS